MENSEQENPSETSSEENINLGGNIQLTGFRDLDRSSMIIVKKIVGNFAKKITDMCENLQQVHVRMKLVHQTEGSEKYEIKSKIIDNGKVFNSEVLDRNLFFALNDSFQKIENSIKK